jgi:hypothetical protein
MQRFWRFLRDKRNRKVLGWLGGGLVVVAMGLWTAFVYFSPPRSTPPGAQADCGGVAIGGNVTGATITGGTVTESECGSKTR